MQDDSSNTTRPPEPMIDPASFRVSYSIGRANNRAGRQPPDGPPVCTALIERPSIPPPPMPSIRSRNFKPNGTSTRPVLAIWPTSENTTVPALHGVPSAAYHVAPRAMMTGTVAQVFTLLMIVGWPHRPLSAG